jgi:hypothetical protein
MIRFTAAGLVTRNPNNGASGNSRLAAIIRSNERKKQRSSLRLLTMAHVKDPAFPVTVTITRVAPSTGLDPHDGLGAALKGVIDGIADGLGLANDRDDRVTWKLSQRRGKPREYAVQVEVSQL